MKTKDIKQEVFFNVSSHEIYETLMDSKKHAESTCEDAKISREVGGEFSTQGDYASGKNLELIPDKKIVQSWRASEWPEGHYSKVTYEFEKAKDGTKLTFTQTNVPEEFCDDIDQGWVDYYWEPMKKYFNK